MKHCTLNWIRLLIFYNSTKRVTKKHCTLNWISLLLSTIHCLHPEGQILQSALNRRRQCAFSHSAPTLWNNFSKTKRNSAHSDFVGSRVYAFRCNLPAALLAEWPGSFMCHCGNTGVEWTPNKSQHRKLTLEKKILLPLLQDFKPITFRSQVRHSTNCAIPTPVTKPVCIVQLKNILLNLLCLLIFETTVWNNLKSEH